MQKYFLKQLWKRAAGFGMAFSMAVTLLPTLPAAAEYTVSLPLLSETARTRPDLKKAGTVPASEETITYDQPFAPFTAGSENFRIPGLITLKNGDLLASGDARWEEWNDGGGIDSIASVSSDGGKTWNYSFPLYFPDSYGHAGHKATTIIDPGIVEGPDGTIYFIADVNPTGCKTWGSVCGQGTGYVTVDGKRYLALTEDFNKRNTAPSDDNLTDYPYYVEAFNEEGYARILKRADNTETGYGVDQWYNIYQIVNGEYKDTMTQKQVNSGVDIQQNAFYKGSKFHVYSIDYLWVAKSTDHGRTWEPPVDITDQIKWQSGENWCLVSPGKGITTSTGDIVIGFYHSGGSLAEMSSMVYSTDNGKTWERTEDVKDLNSKSSENEIVELDDGTLRMFYRSNNGKLSYADIVKNTETGKYVMGSEVRLDVGHNSDCNVSAIAYSKKIDGKQAIMVSCPAGGGRANGKIFTFLVDDEQEGNPVTLYHTFTIPGGEASFVYSCLTELPDGSVGCLWEPNHSTMYYKTYDIYDLVPQSAEITDVTIHLELEVGEEYTKTYGNGTPEVSEDVDTSVADVTSKKVIQTLVLRDHTANNDSNLSSFSETVNRNICLEDAEYTFTGTNQANVWEVYNQATKQYFTNNNSAQTFFSQECSNTMKFAPISNTDGTKSFQICRGDTNQRFIIFHAASMTFNTNTSSSNAANEYMILLEKKAVVEDTDIVPGYQRVSAIEEGHSYLIAYLWNGSFMVLYPTNGTAAQTKLIGTKDQMERTERDSISIRAIGIGNTSITINGVAYYINVKDSAIYLNPGDTYDIPSNSASSVTPDGSAVTAAPYQSSELGLFDHKGRENSIDFSTDSFSETKNSDISLDKAEFTFTASGDNWQIQNGTQYLTNKVNWMDTFFTTTATSMKVEKHGNANTFRIGRAEFQHDYVDNTDDIKSWNNALMGYLVFYYGEMDFRSYGTLSKAVHAQNPYGYHGNYWLTLLEKLSAGETAPADTPLEGYKVVSAPQTGHKYLIANVMDDGSVAVLYPAEGTTAQTKLAKRVKKGIRITAGASAGESSVTIDNQTYKFVVQVCNADHTQEASLTLRGNIAATCLEDGYTGDKVCKTCGKIIEKGESVRSLGHDWNTTGTTTAVSETADGVTVYTCKNDSSHTRSEVIATATIYKNFIDQYENAKDKIDHAALYQPDSITALRTVSNRAKTLIDNQASTPLTNAVMVPLAAELQASVGNVVSIRRKLQEDLAEILESSQPIYDAGKQSYYDDTSWNQFVAAFDTAKTITETTPYAGLKSATEALQEKGILLQKLKYRTELRELYDEQKDRTQGENNDATWAVFTAARTAAKAVLDKQDSDVTVAELLKATEDLKAAIRGLRTQTEALAPYISYTAPKAGEYPSVARVTGSNEDDGHQTTIADHAKNPVAFSKADASSTLDIQRLDGIWGFNDQLLSSANNDKFDITGDNPIILSFRLYLKKKPSSGKMGLLAKGDTQYTVQITSNEFEFFTYQGGWKTIKHTISNDQLNRWMNVFAVIDGKGKERIFVDDTSSAITTAAESLQHCNDPFTIACRKQGDTVDQKFTSEYGYLADVKLYSGADMTDAMKTAINLQTLGDDAQTVIKNIVDAMEPTANITASPYDVSTVWSKADGTAMLPTEKFEANKAYTVTSTFKALGDYEFQNSDEFINGVVKGVSTGLENQEEIQANVEVSNDKKTMTVTVSYSSCLCTISEIRLEDAEINIAAGAASGTFTLQPSVILDQNGCTVSGHPGALESGVTYSYSVTDAGTTGATITNAGVVTATASGKAQIAVTAALSNGARLTKTITVDVKKEGVTYHTVTFYKNDGTEETVDVQEIEENGKATEPAAPNRTGYTFRGWYKDSDCTDGEEFDFTNDAITGDTDLYAKWTQNSSETIAVTGISLNETSFTLTGKGATKKLTATVEPANATNKNVKWTSGDSNIASVSDGTVTAVAAGETTITATSEENSTIKAEAQVKVEIDGTITLTAIKISPMRKTLASIGEILQMQAEFEPANAANKEIIWHSSDESVATVSKEGLVTAKSKGYTLITAESADGKVVSEEARITVLIEDTTIPVSKITLNKDKLELTEGEEETLVVSITPENATNQNVIWSSSNSDVAVVSEKGTVTAVGAGEATITVSSEEDSDKKAEAVVTVTKAAPTQKTFTVTFRNGSQTVGRVSVLQGAAVKAPSVTKAGHNFAGWCRDAEGRVSYNLSTPVTADLILYAKWNPIVYKVSFNTNGGTSVQTQNIPYNGLAKKPAAPTKSGFKFIGWYSNAVLTKPFQFTTKITADITLFAKWEAVLSTGASQSAEGISYTVTDAAAKTVTIVKGENKKARKVKIPATVTINGEQCTVVGIDKNAFKGYNKMTSLTIEANLKTIGKGAFDSCKKLKTVTWKVKTIPKMKSGVFKKVTSKVTVKAAKLSKKQKKQFEKALRRAGMKKAKVK